MKLNRAAILLLSVALATGANAMAQTGGAADFGVAVSDSAAERTIALTADTKYVNVVDGETVKFTADGKSFSWHISTWPNVNVFGLEKIAPQDLPANGIKVYVAPNPRYFGA